MLFSIDAVGSCHIHAVDLKWRTLLIPQDDPGLHLAGAMGMRHSLCVCSVRGSQHIVLILPTSWV